MNPKDMLTNPNFCPMPWTGIMYNFDGTVKNCIRSSGRLGNIKEQEVEHILQGTTNLQTQQNMLDRQPGPHCDPCYVLEKNKRSFDIVSDRIFYIRELKSVDTNTYTYNNFDLRTIDVRWTNLCNFACVYCSPEYSSRWADEVGTMDSMPNEQQRNRLKEYIFSRAHNLQHVYLAGGEPLLMKENLELLELLQKVNPGVNLRINTNLSRTHTNVFNKVCEFRNVHWIVSIETVEQEYEYIRHGAVWKDFEENLSIIQNLNHKISFNMLHFLLNYNSIFDCVRYLQNRGFHNNSFIIGALTGPSYFDLRHLPDRVLRELKITIGYWLDTRPGYLLEDGLKNVLSYIQQPFEKDIRATLDQINKMDLRRGIDSKLIFQEFYRDCQ
jgi:MoaA/NifB/PqqE/SkfB family radical SAM enzyme